MRLSRDHRLPRIPRRVQALAAAAALAVAALALGVIAPPASSGSGDARFAGGPHLLVSIYADAESTLWLVDPADPSRRQALFPLAHAPGWAVEGTVSPAGGRLALLVVPPGARDPATDTLLLVSDGGPPRVVARGLDLRGGLAWSSDGAELFARRALPAADGSRRYQLVAFDLGGGASNERTLLERDDVGGLYPVGRAGDGPAYAVAVGAGGSALIAIDGDGATSLRPLSPGVTREWSLSPGGTRLAYTEQRGTSLRVMLLDLDGPELRTAEATGSISTGGSASPVWHPDGTLHAGHFGAGDGEIQTAGADPAGAAPGFDLPLGWSPDGAYLALRTFGGTGPGDPGAQGLAVLGPDGTSRALTDEGLAILGWWHGAD
ncbi:MAG: hypothetical protein F4Y94_09510 [Chloroflexi bacterium]|nr:hypothetical protein [Chloroflexota bacterium]